MDKVLETAVDTYGAYAQMDMAIEEMAELTKEICKSKRGRANRKEVIEEIADVEIMLEQLKYILQIDPEDIDYVKDTKISRLADKLARR